MNSSYCIFDPTDPNIEFKIKYSEGVAKTLEEWISEKTEPVYMIVNAGYFDMVADVSVSLIIIDGEVQAVGPLSVVAPYGNQNLTYYPTSGAFGIYSDFSAEATWIYSINDNASEVYSYPQPSGNCFGCLSEPVPNATFPSGGSLWGAPNAIGSGPVLMKDNVVVDTWEQEMIDAEIAAQRNPRTAICVTNDGRFVTVVVDGRSNQSIGLFLNETANLMQSLNCRDALNLDGGGSTAMIVNGYLTNNPSDATGVRPVPSVLMVVGKSSEERKEEYLSI